jgi:hypothetical protein
MKCFKLFTIGCALLFVLNSCKKTLDLQPIDTTTTQTFYKTQSQVDNALNSVYSQMKNIDMAEYYYELENTATDEGYYYVGTQDGPTTFQNYSTDTYTTGFWAAAYVGVDYANTLLDNIGNATGLDTTYKKRAIGQALFLRSYYFFTLARLYGDIPMPLTSVPNYQIARTPLHDVYNQIIADMTTAEGLLAGYTSTSLGYSERVTQDAVQGMLARVCLYAAGTPNNDVTRFADALAWATKLKATGLHSLNTDYRQIFLNEIQNKYDVREAIWEIGFNYTSATATANNTTGIIGIYWGVPMTSLSATNLYDSGYVYGVEQVHPRLYNAYQSSDLRRDWNIGNYIYENNSAAQGKFQLSPAQLWGRYPNKWNRQYEPAITRSMQRANGTNLPLLRYADVLLMLAEAENEVNGPTAVAYDAINQVRRRAIVPSRVIDNIITVTGSGYTSLPTVTITGGGGSGLVITPNLVNPTTVATTAPNGLSIVVVNGGSNYTSAPTITVGNVWAAGITYAVGTQVAAGANLYTVTTGGISTATIPTNTSGASTGTGAIFTYAGAAASAVAVLGAAPTVDITPGLSKADFRKAVQNERYLELAFEYHRLGDLKRWGILVPTIQSLGNDINGNSPNIPLAPATNFTAAISPVNNITSRDIFWPVPLRDIQLDSKLSQNPGY